MDLQRRLSKQQIVRGFSAVVLVSMATCGGLDTIEVQQTATTTIPKRTFIEELAGDLGFGDLVGSDLAHKTRRSRIKGSSAIRSIRCTSQGST